MFRLAYRQAEELLGSVVGLLGPSLRVPHHTTLSRRAATLDVPRPGNAGAGAGSEPMHRLVDSTGLKLCGKGGWRLGTHGTATRRPRRTLHLGVDADTGQIVASTLTTKGVDDAPQAGPLLDQVAGPVASFTGDGAYDQGRVYASVAERHPETAVVVPPRSTAVPSDTAETAPTQRDGHPQRVADRPGLPFLGTGEAGQGPTAAAIADALCGATGMRLRDLPLSQARVKNAIGA